MTAAHTGRYRRMPAAIPDGLMACRNSFDDSFALVLRRKWDRGDHVLTLFAADGKAAGTVAERNRGRMAHGAHRGMLEPIESDPSP